jgi:hypothetical protein
MYNKNTNVVAGSKEDLVVCKGPDPCKKKVDENVRQYLPFFVAGQALQGMGFTPMFTCGFAYYDDHVPPDTCAVFMGKWK